MLLFQALIAYYIKSTASVKCSTHINYGISSVCLFNWSFMKMLPGPNRPAGLLVLLLYCVTCYGALLLQPPCPLFSPTVPLNHKVTLLAPGCHSSQLQVTHLLLLIIIITTCSFAMRSVRVSNRLQCSHKWFAQYLIPAGIRILFYLSVERSPLHTHLCLSTFEFLPCCHLCILDPTFHSVNL